MQDHLKLNHGTKSITQMLLELSQAWCCDHFPEESVPVTNRLLSEEHFPNLQSELPLIHNMLFGVSLQTTFSFSQ